MHVHPITKEDSAHNSHTLYISEVAWSILVQPLDTPIFSIIKFACKIITELCELHSNRNICRSLNKICQAARKQPSFANQIFSYTKPQVIIINASKMLEHEA